ncbi:MAG: hypothetical protein HRU28_16135 [Rhizobiales bacterium]|nr:hypothetical protein [Hyphomicrobiales bacterium]
MQKNQFVNSNRAKQESGAANLENVGNLLSELLEQKIIKDFKKRTNFSRIGYEYKSQYLANYIIRTIDNKFIIIRTSNSYKQDRIKTPYYDIDGILNHSNISEEIVASIMLYPDDQLEKIKSFRKNILSKHAHSPASHIFVMHEFVAFLEVLRNAVELDNELREENTLIRDGSFFGKEGIKYEKQIVNALNNHYFLQQLIETEVTDNSTFSLIVDTICTQG